MKLWKQRLFARLQRPADDGSDLSGDIIDVNGKGDDAPTDDPEDRGDVVTPPAADDDKPDASSPSAEPKSGSIPKARFDEVNERRKTAEQELEAMRNELQALKSSKPVAQAQSTQQEAKELPADAFDEDAKEQAYIEAMLDGDTAKAKEIRKEINANLRKQAASEVRASNAQAEQAGLLSRAAEKASQEFPYLDTDDGAYALGLIVAARDAAIAKGVPAHQALSEAVAKIAPRFAPDGTTPPTRDLPEKKPAADTRTQQALERGALDSTRQPPQMQGGLGNRSDKVRVDVQALDEDQFAALTPAEKKALRGD